MQDCFPPHSMWHLVESHTSTEASHDLSASHFIVSHGFVSQTQVENAGHEKAALLVDRGAFVAGTFAGVFENVGVTVTVSVGVTVIVAVIV